MPIGLVSLEHQLFGNTINREKEKYFSLDLQLWQYAI